MTGVTGTSALALAEGFPPSPVRAARALPPLPHPQLVEPCATTQTRISDKANLRRSPWLHCLEGIHDALAETTQEGSFQSQLWQSRSPAMTQPRFIAHIILPLDWGHEEILQCRFPAPTKLLPLQHAPEKVTAPAPAGSTTGKRAATAACI